MSFALLLLHLSQRLTSMSVVYESSMKSLLVANELKRSEAFIWQALLCNNIDRRLSLGIALLRDISPCIWTFEMKSMKK